MDGGLEVVSFYGLDGRDPMCLEVVRIDFQPEFGQLLLGVIAVQGLGNSHGPFDNRLVAGLLGSFQVINEGNVVAAALGRNFGRQ